LKQKEINIELAELFLELFIDINLAYCTDISDLLTMGNCPDLADRLTDVVLKTVSQDTIILIGILAILQTKKVRKKKP